MPSPSEAAQRAAAAYMTSGNPLLQLHPNDTRELALAFDSFAAAQVEAAVAAARAEMRERCAVACAEQHDGSCVLCHDCRTRRQLQAIIRALPLDPEVTK